MIRILMKRSRAVGVTVLLGTLTAAGCMPASAPLDEHRFAPLDAAGQPIADGEGGHHCVLDRMTELTWEVVRPGSGLHAPGHRFSWYSADRRLHMGDPGRQGGGQCALSRCDTEALVEAVNAQGLCGQHDWRLPSREEAILLGKHHGDSAIGMNPRFFPGAVPGEFWTASTFRLYPQSAWAFDAGTGLDRADRKTEAKPVRLVRGTMVLPRKRG